MLEKHAKFEFRAYAMFEDPWPVASWTSQHANRRSRRSAIIDDIIRSAHVLRRRPRGWRIPSGLAFQETGTREHAHDAIRVARFTQGVVRGGTANRHWNRVRLPLCSDRITDARIAVGPYHYAAVRFREVWIDLLVCARINVFIYLFIIFNFRQFVQRKKLRTPPCRRGAQCTGCPCTLQNHHVHVRPWFPVSFRM